MQSIPFVLNKKPFFRRRDSFPYFSFLCGQQRILPLQFYLCLSEYYKTRLANGCAAARSCLLYVVTTTLCLFTVPPNCLTNIPLNYFQDLICISFLMDWFFLIETGLGGGLKKPGTELQKHIIIIAVTSEEATVLNRLQVVGSFLSQLLHSISPMAKTTDLSQQKTQRQNPKARTQRGRQILKAKERRMQEKENKGRKGCLDNSP